MAGHENMTLNIMAHARNNYIKKLSFNDVDPWTVFFLHILRKTFSHLADLVMQFDTFSVDMFDTFSGSRQFDTFSVDTFDTFSVDTCDTFSGPTLDTFSLDLIHLAVLTHLAVPHS